MPVCDLLAGKKIRFFPGASPRSCPSCTHLEGLALGPPGSTWGWRPPCLRILLNQNRLGLQDTSESLQDLETKGWPLAQAQGPLSRLSWSQPQPDRYCCQATGKRVEAGGGKPPAAISSDCQPSTRLRSETLFPHGPLWSPRGAGRIPSDCPAEQRRPQSTSHPQDPAPSTPATPPIPGQGASSSQQGGLRAGQDPHLPSAWPNTHCGAALHPSTPTAHLPCASAGNQLHSHPNRELSHTPRTP